MSTRATIHFTHAKDAKPTAIIYRHSDGYPEGLGEDLKTFVKDLQKNLRDNRLNDPSYLAAKWVVWDAMQHQKQMNELSDKMGAKYAGEKTVHPLDFLGVGICMEDPGDIEYRWTVICDGTGTISHEEV